MPFCMIILNRLKLQNNIFTFSIYICVDLVHKYVFWPSIICRSLIKNFPIHTGFFFLFFWLTKWYPHMYVYMWSTLMLFNWKRSRWIHFVFRYPFILFLVVYSDSILWMPLFFFFHFFFVLLGAVCSVAAAAASFI